MIIKSRKSTHLAGLVLGGMMSLIASEGVTSTGAVMQVQGLTTQPIGHYEFCQRSPVECSQKTSGKTVKLTRNLWSKLVNINTSVNTLITPITDQELWGQPELWSYPTTFGDCEDYVLLKRKMLIDEGVPAGNLLITVVRQPNGEGHAVLSVRTDRGDFILDNLEGEVKLWNNTEYRYLKRQSNTHSGKWVSINDARTITVGSVN